MLVTGFFQSFEIWLFNFDFLRFLIITWAFVCVSRPRWFHRFHPNSRPFRRRTTIWAHIPPRRRTFVRPTCISPQKVPYSQPLSIFAVQKLMRLLIWQIWSKIAFLWHFGLYRQLLFYTGLVGTEDLESGISEYQQTVQSILWVGSARDWNSRCPVCARIPV